MNGDPIDAILQGEQKPSPAAIQQPSDALDSALQGISPPGTDPLDEALKGTGHATPHSLAHRIADFVVHGLIIEPLKQVSAFVEVGLKSGAAGRMPSPYGQEQAVQETSDYMSDPANQEKIAQGMRGAALVGSFAGGPIVRAAPVIGPLLGKWTSFLTGEFLGGAIYGGVRPLEGDESRTSAVLNDAALFAATGGIFKGLGEITGAAYKRFILGMPRAKRDAALKIVKEELAKVEASLGTTIDQVHPEAAAKIEEPILAQAIQQVDPGAVDLDAIVRAEADRAIEPTPRLGGEKRAPLKLEPSPGEEFQKQLEEMKPIPGTARGFEVTGPRKIPPVPTEPTVTEMLEGKKPVKRLKISGKMKTMSMEEAEAGLPVEEGGKGLSTTGATEPEQITGVVVKGRSGKVHPALPGETHHAQIMARLMEKGTPSSEFINEETGAYSHADAAGYVTNKRPFVSKNDAVKAGLEGATSMKATSPLLDPAAAEANLESTVEETAALHRLRNALDPISGGLDAAFSETALMDAATDHAVANTTPMEVSSPTVKATKQALDQATVDPAGVRLIGPKTSHYEPSRALVHRNTLPGEKPWRLTRLHPNPEMGNPPWLPRGHEDFATKEEALKTALDAEFIIQPESGPHLEPSTISLKKKPSEAIKKVMEKALLRESPAAEEGVVLELTSPTPGELKVRKAVPDELKDILTKSLSREKAPIEIAAGEQVGAPWSEGMEQLVIPKELNGIEIGARMDDKQLDEMKTSLLNLARGEAGKISGRLLLATTGSAMEALSVDDNWSPAQKTGLRALGGFLILAAAHPRLAEYFKNNQIVRKFLLQYSPEKVMAAAQHPELFRAYRDAMTASRAESIIKFRDAIRSIVPDKNSHQSFMFSAEEGPAAPEWHMLTQNQQQAALVLNQLELRRGILLKQEGVLDEYIDNYVRHLLPPKSYQAWRTQGFKVLPTGGSFTKPRRIDTLRELVNWTAKQGLEPPVMDPAAVYSIHNDEANRALATVRLRNALDKQGLILDFDPKKPIPDKWRPVSILGMMNKIAPEEVATALENLSSPKSHSIELINSLDTIKSYWMRSIMVWPWEHGLNVLRSIPAIASNPAGFVDAWKLIKQRDPGLVEAAKHGADLFSRPDYGVRSHEGFQRLMGIIKLPGAGAAIDRKIEMMDKWLWEQVVPSLQYFAYSTRMHSWAERTGGKFLPSSPEYGKAARAAADFSNTVAGRIPQELTNPSLARMMRFAMFSPQWTSTRLALIAHAAGELGDIVAGKLDPRDAAYLPFKMRQLAWGIAITWLGSKLMSGNEPQFNPNSSKFYMRTGLRNARGQEIGLDVIGWWETDLQAFNHPLNFMFNRLNPLVKIAGETIQGRDYLGREMTTGQTIGNIISSFGAGAALPVSAAGIATRAISGPPIRGGELLQMASQSSGAFNTATLPRPMDAAIGKFAKKILIRQNIPATNDNVFQLSRILRANILAGRDMVDNQVINWLSYYKRAERVKNPISSAIGRGPPLGEDFQGMWQEARRVLAEF